MSKHVKPASGSPDPEPETIDRQAGLGSADCEVCGERLGARDVWRKGEWFGHLCPDCEKDGRRGVARSRPPV